MLPSAVSLVKNNECLLLSFIFLIVLLTTTCVWQLAWNTEGCICFNYVMHIWAHVRDVSIYNFMLSKKIQWVIE